MTYATAADVSALWAKEPEEAVIAAVERRLGQVERMILRKIPDLHSRVEAGLIDVDDVVQIEADAVLRHVRNPDGMVSEADGAYTYQLSGQAIDTTLRILQEEWERLGVPPVRGMFVLAPRLAASDRG